MKILGISAFYHNSAAALIIDGEIVSAVEEERFTRVKNDSSFPQNSIMYCLKESNVTLNELDSIVFYDNPNIKFDRFVKTMISTIPYNYKYYKERFFQWVNDKLFLEKTILNDLFRLDSKFCKEKTTLKFLKHHLSHAASAYYPSNLDEAIIVVIDGVGEWQTTTIMKGVNGKITPYKEILFPNSLGLLYSTFTAYLGFKVNNGEYKVMGLSPYGEDKYSKIIKNNLIKLNLDGSFTLNQKYFSYTYDTIMFNKHFTKLFGREQRQTHQELDSFHADIAKSLQVVLEEAILNICKYAHKELQINNLVLAGGVALNCVANSKIYDLELFENIWIQPAAGDAGSAIGAALFEYYQYNEYKTNPNKFDFMKGSLLGPQYSDKEIMTILDAYGATYYLKEESEILEETATLLSNGNVIGWHQGKAEFGPRSLGNRSILANPLLSQMQEKINLKIKFRESFRPFAPAVLEEDASTYFSMNKSPYMLFTATVKDQIKVENKEKFLDKLKQPRSKIPAVTHVDYSARLQTVSKESNAKFHKLLHSFKEKTSCSVLINTSFNVRGEPIVLTPENSFRCFMMTDMDILVIENIILYKQEQKNILDFEEIKNTFIRKDTSEATAKVKYKHGIDRDLVLREHTPKIQTYVKSKDFFNICDNYIDKEYKLTTDINGFIEPSKIHKHADADIVFIGGSTTECMYVDEKYRFPYLAGRLLEKETGKKVNSYNAGVSGNTSQNSIINLIGKIFALEEVSMVVMMHHINDLIVLLLMGTYYVEHGNRGLYKYEDKEELNVKDEFAELKGTKVIYDLKKMKKSFIQNLKTFISICEIREITPVLMTMVNRTHKNSVNNKEWLNDLYYQSIKNDYNIDLDEYLEMIDLFNEIIRDVSKEHNVILVDLADKIPLDKELIYDMCHFNNAGSINASYIISNTLKNHI